VGFCTQQSPVFTLENEFFPHKFFGNDLYRKLRRLRGNPIPSLWFSVRANVPHWSGLGLYQTRSLELQLDETRSLFVDGQFYGDYETAICDKLIQGSGLWYLPVASTTGISGVYCLLLTSDNTDPLRRSFSRIGMYSPYAFQDQDTNSNHPFNDLVLARVKRSSIYLV
jgi:hypothetical protein